MALPELPNPNGSKRTKNPSDKKSGGMPTPPGGKLPTSLPPMESGTKQSASQSEEKSQSAPKRRPKTKSAPAPKTKSTDVDNGSKRQTQSSHKKPSNSTRRKKQESQIGEPDADDGWAFHDKTGTRYKKIPPAKYDSDGEPVRTITDDIDDPFDMNKASDIFLAHLRVPPNSEEQKKFMEEKMRNRKEQDKKYQEETAKIVPKE